MALRSSVSSHGFTCLCICKMVTLPYLCMISSMLALCNAVRVRILDVGVCPELRVLGTCNEYLCLCWQTAVCSWTRTDLTGCTCRVRHGGFRDVAMTALARTPTLDTTLASQCKYVSSMTVFLSQQ